MPVVINGTTGITTPAIDSGNIVGQVCFFAMTTAPTGFIKANGAAISRTTFSALFVAISTTFGVGDGSTTFNVPDLRGEFPRGFDDGRGVDSARVFGSAQSDAFKSHVHSLNAAIQDDGQTVYNLVGAGARGGATNTTGAANPAGATETRPRNIALLACIKF